MKKPLSVTSPDHAAALSLYFILGVSGLLGVFNLNRQTRVTEYMGDALADVWSTSLMVSAFSAFAAAATSRKGRTPENHMKVEGWSTALIGVCMSYVVYILIKEVGPSGVVTGSLAVAVGVGSFFRVWQIWTELRLIKRARQQPVKSDPVLADPRDIDGDD